MKLMNSSRPQLVPALLLSAFGSTADFATF